MKLTVLRAKLHIAALRASMKKLSHLQNPRNATTAISPGNAVSGFVLAEITTDAEYLTFEYIFGIRTGPGNLFEISKNN